MYIVHYFVLVVNNILSFYYKSLPALNFGVGAGVLGIQCLTK